MENTCNLKDLSLQLYEKEVEITLKESSSSHETYNTLCLSGTLICRLWGDGVTSNGHKEDTIIALTIRKDEEELEILCKDIECLK